jgi:LmeA-like phospholipid-binding
VARGRGTKVGIGLLVLLLIVLGVLIIVDRVAVGEAESQIAQQTRKELTARDISTPADPKVSISGFPFLTQVLAGKYEKITISIAQPKINNVQLDKLDVVATTVRADAQSVLKGTGDVVADKITGTTTISWDNVRPLLQLAGLPKGVDPAQVELKVVNNQIQLRVPFTINGSHFAVTAKGTLVVESGAVQVRLDEVGSDAGSAPAFVQNLIKRYQKNLTVRIKIPQMPFKLVVNRVQSSTAGLTMIASADDVKLSST